MLKKSIFSLMLFLTIGLVGLIPTASSTAEKPLWIIDEEAIPSDWSYDTEFEVDGRFYLSLQAPSTATFSVETFVEPINASERVIADYRNNLKVHEAGDLIYVFPNDRVNLSYVDNGYVWEIKSPCCYSRGVVFALNNTYVYIFGSQAAEWTEVSQIYTLQILELYDYYNLNLPDELRSEPSASNVPVDPLSVLMGLTFVALVVLVRQHQR